MVFQEKIDELKAYVDKWGLDLRSQLQLPASPEASVGISFMSPDFALDSVPQQSLPAAGGIWEQRLVERPVEVVRVEGQLVYISYGAGSGSKVGCISAELFADMFFKVEIKDLNITKTRFAELLRSNDDTPESKL
jgi:hypothetical protein